VDGRKGWGDAVSHNKSIVLVVTAGARNAAHALATALGHQPADGITYGIPLSPTGAEPATHFATHTWAQASFVAQLLAVGAVTSEQAAAVGVLPADAAAAGAALTAAGIDMSVVATVVAGLTASARPYGAQEPSAHFDEVLGAMGLQRIEETPPDPP
jgi:hypothetical protein